MKQLTARLGDVSYAKEAVRRVKAVEAEIEALPTAEQKLLDDCLQISALNAADMDDTIAEFFSEISGCVNINTNVTDRIHALISKMNANL